MMFNKQLWTGVLASLLVWSSISTATAKTVLWNVTGYTGVWDTTSVNWKDADTNLPTTFANGDTVIFPTFSTLGGGSHYTDRTVTISGTVAPNSINFNPGEINYLHFAGGDISGTAAGITVDSSWSANQSRMWFDANASYSFTGNVSVTEGNNLYYRPSTAGTYNLGSGEIRIADVVGGSTTSFNYEPTVVGTTLTNDVRAQTGLTTFNWGNAPTFTGNLYLDSDIRFNSVGGGYEHFDWNGNVILSGNRTITGGVRDLTPSTRSGGLHFGGEFTGPTHTLTLDFQSTIGGGAGLGMKATQDTGAWNVGNLVLTNGAGGLTFGGGNTPNLLVATTNATDDHFATLRNNGGKVTIQNGAQLFLRKGTINFADLQSDATGRVLIDMTNAAFDVRLAGNGMYLSSATGAVRNAVVGFNIGSPGQLRGDITLAAGGQLTLTGLYNEALKHYSNPNIADTGHLKMLDGSALNVQWGTSNLQLNAGYEFQTAGQKLYLGDGSASTAETITMRGLMTLASGMATGTFFMGTDNANIVDDGNVTLRYESTTGSGDFNIGWSTLANIQAMNYASGTIAYQFRGGSAGTEFAPLSVANSIGAIGPTTGTVFTATSPTSLVTTGEVGFYNSGTTSPASGHRAAPGAVLINDGGTFDLVAAGTAIASTWTVNDGGSVSGIGTFVGNMTLNDGGAIAPGNSVGTLTINGGLTLNDGAIYEYEIDQTAGLSDAIIVTGNLTASGTQVLQLTQLDDAEISVADEFLLFTISGTLPNGLPNFDIFSPTLNVMDASVFQLGNQIWLTGVTNVAAVPEPNSLLLLGCGALGLVARRRRVRLAC